MSGLVTGLVLKYAPVENQARLLVLVTLAECAHDDGTGAYPSVETIRDRSRAKSRRTVQNALRDLEAEGLIEPTGKRPTGTVIYRVCVETFANLSAGRRSFEPRESAIERGGAIDAPLSSDAPPGAHGDAPEPSLRTVQNHPLPREGDSRNGVGRISPRLAAGWRDVLGLVASQLDDFKAETWIRPVELLDVEGPGVHLIAGVPEHLATSVRERYRPLLLAAAREIVDPRCTLEIRAHQGPAKQAAAEAA